MKKLDIVLDPLLDFHLQTIFDKESTKSGASLKEVNPRAWLESSATIKVDPGRQTGTSSYIARTASHLDVIICPDQYALEHMTAKRRGFFLPDSQNMRIYLASQWDQITFDVQDVWIDESRSIKNFDMDRLYFHFAGKCRRFIIIG